MGILRSFGAPFRHYFNQHFEMVKDEVRRNAVGGGADVARLSAELRASVDALLATTGESQLFNARQLSEIRQRTQVSTETAERVLGQLETLRALIDPDDADVLDRLAERVATVHGQRLVAPLEALLTPPVPRSVDDVSPRDAALLNRMNAHDGFRSQAGVWINEPLSTGFEGGVLGLHDVNERIGELPFVFGRLGGLAHGSRILDVGCCESIVALSLASMGHWVTALDPRPYPFAHPRLTVVTQPVESFRPDTPFDAVVLLSTIEHLGVGSYGLETGARADLAAMAHLRELLVPGGRLVLTTPFGVRGMNELERTYDVAGVHELIDGYELVDEPSVLVRRSRTEWIVDRGGFSDVDDDRQRVVMLDARRPG